MKPKHKFLQVLISAELRTQGLRLLEHLIRKHLIFGGPVFSGPARFVPSHDIPKRTISSWGDLSQVQPVDPTR